MPENRSTILIVDDDAALRETLQEALANESFDVTSAASGEDALRKLSILAFDLAIVDLKLPGMDGVQLVRDIRRRWPDVLIIVLTAFPTLDSTVACLRAGVYDYLFKPSGIGEIRRSMQDALAKQYGYARRVELLETLQEQLSRGLHELREAVPDTTVLNTPITDGAKAIGRFVQTGSLIIDRERHEVMLGDEQLELTPTEFEILAYLVERAPGVISALELARRAMGYDAGETEARELVKWHIHHLRQKIEIDASNPVLLKNIRGIGYKLEVM